MLIRTEEVEDAEASGAATGTSRGVVNTINSR
jgi:hypothetical protein